VEARGLEPPNLLTASQALYQLSYAPEGFLLQLSSPVLDAIRPKRSSGGKELHKSFQDFREQPFGGGKVEADVALAPWTEFCALA
jgi:hypothetical protein